MRSRIRFISVCVALGAGAAGCGASDDGDFARQADRIGRLEIELGNYALNNAGEVAVRDFGQSMATDHQRVNDELAQLAQRLGISLHDGLSAKEREESETLMNLRGPEFDEAYLRAMVKGHEDAVAAFNAQADQNRSELDRWAAKTLPVLRRHLNHARELESIVQARQHNDARVSINP